MIKNEKCLSPGQTDALIKWKTPEVNLTSSVMIKLRMIIYFVIVLMKAPKDEEVFAMTIKHSHHERKTNLETVL